MIVRKLKEKHEELSPSPVQKRKRTKTSSCLRRFRSFSSSSFYLQLKFHTHEKGKLGTVWKLFV